MLVAADARRKRQLARKRSWDGAKRNLGDDGKEEAMPRPKAVRLTIQEALAGMLLPVTCEEGELELDRASRRLRGRDRRAALQRQGG